MDNYNPASCALAGTESLQHHLFLCTIDKLGLALANHNHTWTTQERELYEGCVDILTKKVCEDIDRSTKPQCTCKQRTMRNGYKDIVEYAIACPVHGAMAQSSKTEESRPVPKSAGLESNVAAKTTANRPIMPLSCEGCTLKETIHCQSCVRNATTDWYTTA